MKKEKLKSIVLSRTVVFEGRHYPPESVQEWPVSIADELGDKWSRVQITPSRPSYQ